MCSSSKSPDPDPILPPPPEPAEFLNEELQKSVSSRKILGIRRLQVPLLGSLGAAAGGAGGSVGGPTGSLGGLSNVRGTAKRSTGTLSSVKVGGLQKKGLDVHGNVMRSSTSRKGGRTFTRTSYGSATGRNVTTNGVSSFQVSSRNFDSSRAAAKRRGD